MELVFLACAESASIDQATNKLSLFNVIEEFSGVVFPGMVQTAALVLIFTKEAAEPDQANLEISIVHNGQRLFSAPLVVQFQQLLRSRVIAHMNGLPLNGPGQVSFDVSHNGKSLGKWSVEVKAIPAPAITIPAQQVPAVNAISNVASPVPRARAVRRAAKKKKA
jgi:hypothetical protein